MEQDRSIAVIGLGYVGLPLALGFVEAGVAVDRASTPARRGSTSSTAGSSPIEDIPDARLVAALGAGFRAIAPDPGRRPRRRRRLRLRPDAGDDDQGPRPRPRPLSRRARPRRAPGRPPRRPPVDDLPGHDDRPVPGRCSSARPASRAGVDFDLAFAPERVNPGDPASSAKLVPRLVGGSTPAATARAAALLRQHQRRRRRALLARRGRDGEAPRERLPQHQHRLRQPARPALRADGPRRLGGHRRGGHQAVRLHEVHARVPASAGTASRSTPTTSPGGPASSTSPTASSSWPPTSTWGCPATSWTSPPRRSTTARGRSRAPGSASSGVAFKPDVGDAREAPAAARPGRAPRAGRRGPLPRSAHRAVPRRSRARPTPRRRSTSCSAGRELLVIVTAHRAIDWDAVYASGDLILDTVNASRNRAPRPRQVLRLGAGWSA